MDVPTVLKEVLGLTGMTQADLARKIEVSQGTISKWLSEQQSPNKRQWDQFVDIVTKDKRTKHLVAARAAVETVPVVGYVGAGAETEFFGEQGRYGEVRAPDGATPNTVAVEVRGESLGPLFDRWLVFYDDVHRPVAADLVGKLCVVGLEDGRVLVKKLQRSRTKGLFHLLSNTEAPILDVPIEWAARVKGLAPR